MTNNQKTCTQCQSLFEVTEEDQRVLRGFNVPDPNFCFHCRLQRKMTFYNRRKLYKRTCDLTGKTIISTYSPDKPYTVYNIKDWYSDKWDPMEYGQDFDFSRPFAEQFAEVMAKIPHPSLAVLGENVNSDYTSDNYKLENCYLIFDGEQAQDSYYGESFMLIRGCMDFFLINNSQFCYETIGCEYSYDLKYSQFSKNCSNSWFLKDCIACKSCFGCINLRQKEYHIFNQPVSKEEYKAFMDNFNSGNHEEVMKMKKKSRRIPLKIPRKSHQRSAK